VVEKPPFQRVLRSDALAGKVALVTGAARGIGRGIALELAHAGADVALNDLGPASESEDLQHIIRGLGRRVSFHRADVSEHAAVEVMMREVVEQHGRLDILINNAGMQQWEPFLEITDAAIDRTLNVDLKGVIYCGQAAARQMVQQSTRGRIVNISSVHAVYSIKTAAVYDAAKAAVKRLTATMALELAEQRITVNAIAPGWIDTPLNRPFLDTAEGAAGVLATIPLQRVGEPQEIGHLAAYLCTDAASYITGAFIVIDGGYILGG
jgi:NAD(P)-dependent dehydrogenase (short-subunit alcohol dehydrogenase family)